MSPPNPSGHQANNAPLPLTLEEARDERGQNLLAWSRMLAAGFRAGWQFLHLPPTGNTRNISLLENQTVWQQTQLRLKHSHTLHRVNNLALLLCNKTPLSPFVSVLELLLQCIIGITGRKSALSNIIHRVKSHH